MGYETKCSVRVERGDGDVRTADDATVLLETDELIIRGAARIRVPRTSIERVTRRGGTVTVASPEARITLSLGADAASKWERKLQEAPKRLIDKLDVKPGALVWVFGVEDADLIAQLRERADVSATTRAPRRVDVAFVQVGRAADFARIAKASKPIAPAGAMWVVHPKGPSGVPDTAIFAEAKKLGLAAIKVARVSDTESAEKLVWPRASRGS
jgi:hypothetical protein